MAKNIEVEFYQRENRQVLIIGMCFCMVLLRKLWPHLREKLTGHCDIWKTIKGGIKMSKAGVSFDLIKNDLMQDEEFKKEYDRLRPRYEIISQIIEIRKEQHMTQEELAKRVGTQKSNISRLESGNYNPSLDFLIKVARSLGKELSIHME